jgi:hypothetical protein
MIGPIKFDFSVFHQSLLHLSDDSRKVRDIAAALSFPVAGLSFAFDEAQNQNRISKSLSVVAS